MTVPVQQPQEGDSLRIWDGRRGKKGDKKDKRKN